MKVAIVGGGGWFALDLIRKVFSDERMRPIDLRLHDINPRKLEAVGQIIDLANEATGAGVRYSLHTDLDEALQGVGHVISCFCVDHVPSRAADMAACNRHGVFPLEGETMTPGGLMNTLRHLPILLDVCRRMERLCPDAFLQIINNPLARLCDGVHRHTRIKFVGHCHGITHTRRELARAMGLDPDDVEVIAAGVNHLTFILEMRDRRTGEDLLPRIPAALGRIMQHGPFGFRFSNLVYTLLGYYPSPGDNHIADQLPFVSEAMKRDIPIPSLDEIYPDPEEVRAGRGPQEQGVLQLPEHLRRHPEMLQTFLHPRHNEMLGDCLLAREGRIPPLYFEAYNLPNQGLISNLPAGSIVEVPGVIDTGGVRGVGIGELPEPLADLCRRMLVAHEAAVEACVHGSREAALRSLAYEPTVRDLTVLEALLDDLLDANRRYLSAELYESLRRPGPRGRLALPPQVPPAERRPSRYQVGIIGTLAWEAAAGGEVAG